MERLYTEFQENKNDVKQRLNGIENRLGKIEISIAQDFKPDIKSLYDGYKQTYEKIESVEVKVNDIAEKVDRHNIN